MSHILQSYKRGLMCAGYNWKLIILLFLMNAGLMFLSVGPLSNLLAGVLGNSLELQQLSKGFNYTTLMDLVNNHGSATNISILALFGMFIPYALWLVFSSGGIVEVAKTYSVRSSLFVFWQGAARYFFRFIRLTLYILVIYALLFFMAWKFFAKDGLNPLNFESENLLISRFWVLTAILLFIGFLISSYRDICKVTIGQNDNPPMFFDSTKESFKLLFSPKFLLLSLLNVFVLLLLVALYSFLKKLTGNAFWLGIVLSQLFLLFRIIYRIVRIGSFKQFYVAQGIKN